MEKVLLQRQIQLRGLFDNKLLIYDDIEKEEKCDVQHKLQLVLGRPFISLGLFQLFDLLLDVFLRNGVHELVLS